jgi:exopolysaccharide production protein ExoQ
LIGLVGTGAGTPSREDFQDPMIPKLVLLCFTVAVLQLLRRDAKLRTGISPALWIPTLWVIILSSRPLSMWLQAGGGNDSLEGSPLDRLFYFVLIAAAFYVISQRRVDWSAVVSRNWAIFLFYLFMLISVGWADSPLVSFKRWFKEFGNIIVLLVILTEANPPQAFRTVFFRCACMLIPLSLIYIRWFPELGRVYNIHSGEMEAIGVTGQKNSLGALVLVGGLVVLWDLLELLNRKAWARYRTDLLVRLGILMIGGYLINLCDAKTSIVCLTISVCLLLAANTPQFRERPGVLGILTVAGVSGFALLDWLFGIKEAAVEGLGRDLTFTGRTDVWRELLALNTNPLIGTGFCSFWSDEHYLAKLPDWVAHSAHNGYLEIYIDGGWLGIFFLGVMLLSVGFGVSRRLAAGGNYAVVCFAVFVATLLDNYSESYFAKMTPVGFLFLLSAMDYAHVTETETVSKPAAFPAFPRTATALKD